MRHVFPGRLRATLAPWDFELPFSMRFGIKSTVLQNMLLTPQFVLIILRCLQLYAVENLSIGLGHVEHVW